MQPARWCVVGVSVFAMLAGGAGACARESTPSVAPILLFAGKGTSRGDLDAVASILDHEHLQYATANSAQLNTMSLEQLMAYRLMIVPGGNFIDMSASLTPQTTTNVHTAVARGLNYLGICAGAFIAGDGRGHYNGIDLTSGVRFGFYGIAKQGIRKPAVTVTSLGAPPMEQYWEDGPELTGWGDVVARYPDGTPAVAEGMSGKGWVILSGVHPEAPESWRRGINFTTTATASNSYAGTLVRAALTRTALPHY